MEVCVDASYRPQESSLGIGVYIEDIGSWMFHVSGWRLTISEGEKLAIRLGYAIGCMYSDDVVVYNDSQSACMVYQYACWTGRCYNGVADNLSRKAHSVGIEFPLIARLYSSVWLSNWVRANCALKKLCERMSVWWEALSIDEVLVYVSIADVVTVRRLIFWEHDKDIAEVILDWLLSMYSPVLTLNCPYKFVTGRSIGCLSLITSKSNKTIKRCRGIVREYEKGIQKVESVIL